jgi:hypothetical protein
VYIKDTASTENFKFVGLGQITSRKKNIDMSYTDRGKSFTYYDLEISPKPNIINAMRALASLPTNMMRLIIKQSTVKHKLFENKVKVIGAHEVGRPKDETKMKIVGTNDKTGRTFHDDILITAQSNKQNIIHLGRNKDKGLFVLPFL